MLSMLLAYDDDGIVVATLDYLVQLGADGRPRGLIDFAAHEANGGRLREIWDVGRAVGSGTWPEWIGARAHDFRVELEPGWSRADPTSTPHAVRALVHRRSGQRRQRADIENAIAGRIADSRARALSRGDAEASVRVDIRDIVGGPGRPLRLDRDGRTVPRVLGSDAPRLPLVRRPHEHAGEIGPQTEDGGQRTNRNRRK